MREVIISICLRNEQATIRECLDSILASARVADCKFKIVICFNGTTDGSKEIVSSWVSLLGGSVDTVILDIPSANLVSAQRACVQQGGEYSYFAFFDADIVVDLECISLLMNGLEVKNVAVVYARSVVLNRGRETLLERVVNLYDMGPSIYSHRKHLHGRAFMTRDWYIPETEPSLLVDDIYLSFYYLNKYGPSSIRMIYDAKIFFYQIRSWSDFYRVYRRRKIELHKCFSLFPDFIDTPKNQVNRRIIWQRFWTCSVSNKSLWILLFLYKYIASVLYRYQTFISPVNREQWETSLSSKRVRTKPYLVLIEGLDCSGKKTLARYLRKDLEAKGVSTDIVVGPLGPGWYKYVSRFVSLHRFPGVIRSFIYSIEILVASRVINRSRFDVIIQSSSVLRSLAYSKMRNNKVRVFFHHIFRYRVPYYDKVIYLTVDYETRMRRHKSQVASGENPNTLSQRFRGKRLFTLQEKNLLKLLHSHFSDVIEVDTKEMLPQDIVNSVIGKIKL